MLGGIRSGMLNFVQVLREILFCCLCVYSNQKYSLSKEIKKKKKKENNCDILIQVRTSWIYVVHSDCWKVEIWAKEKETKVMGN